MYKNKLCLLVWIHSGNMTTFLGIIQALISENLIYGHSQLPKRGIGQYFSLRVGETWMPVFWESPVLSGTLFSRSLLLMAWTAWSQKKHPGRPGDGEDPEPRCQICTPFLHCGALASPTHVKSARYPEEIQDSSLWGHPRAPWLTPVPTDQKNISFIKSCVFGPPKWYQHVHLWWPLLISGTGWDQNSSLPVVYHWPVSLSLCLASCCPCSHRSVPSDLQPPVMVGWQLVFFTLFTLGQGHPPAAEPTPHVWWSSGACVDLLIKCSRLLQSNGHF